MSRTVTCYDNAVIESWHRTLKVGCVYRQRFQTQNEARRSTFDYIETCYDIRRRHVSLGYKSQQEFERTLLSTDS
jgi:putative transposase